jgi:NAD(P)-dependent dehydrogenase (short-subunit alcohol dehydrogenase family)
MFEFEGKTALVTGGTSGIGQAVAESFLRSGANVIAAGLPGDIGAHEKLRITTLDVTDPVGVQGVVEGIPKLDFVVNAAGIIRRDDEFEIGVFEHVLDVNLIGTMRVCTAARRHLARTGGCIVNVASMLSFFGGARVPAYSASKGGVAQLTKSLALAWAAEGIRVNAVAPGWIATPLTEALQQDQARSAQLLSRTALNRWGQPGEIAGPVLFLCSELASFVTGAVIPIDGGYSAA